MKVALVTLFLIFISTSFALGVPKRFGKQISVHSLHLEKISSLGSALKGLIQLADANELDPVIEIIQEILEELTGLLGSNQQDLAVLTQQHEIDEAAAQESIDNIQSSLDGAEQDLANAQAVEQQLQDAIDANVNAINDASAATDAENERRASSHAAYQQHISNINGALQALSDASDILTQIRDQDLTVGGTFIQMQKKKFTKALALVQKKLSKVQLRTSPTEVYIKELVQIAQDVEAQATVNAEIFDQLFVLIESFRQSLVQEAQDAQAADDQDEQQSENALGLLADTIATQRAALNDNQNQLSNVQGQIAAFQGQIANLQQNLADAQANLQNIEDNFAQQSQILGGYIRRLQVDVDVLQRALVFVQTEASQIESGPGSVLGGAGDASNVVEGDEVTAGDVVAEETPDVQLDPSWVAGSDSDSEDVDLPEPVDYAPEPASWQTGPAEDVQVDTGVEVGASAESDESEEAEEESEEESDEESEGSQEAAEEESDEESEGSQEAAEEESDESEESEEESEESAEPVYDY